MIKEIIMLDFSKLKLTNNKPKNPSVNVDFNEEEISILKKTIESDTFEYNLKLQNIKILKNKTNPHNLFETNLNEYSVLGIDGSQIYPSRHEGNIEQGLINIGTAFFHFKKSGKSIFQGSATPYLINHEDINLTNIISDNGLFDLARQCKELEEIINFKEKNNVDLILLDASLTVSNWENKNLERIKYLFFEYLRVLNILEQHDQAIISYTSSPSSKLIINNLRKIFCHQSYFLKNNCIGECQNILCKKLFLNNDSTLFFQLLNQSETSAIFSRKVFDTFMTDKKFILSSLYLKTEQEIVKLETFQPQEVLIQKLHLILDQINKGFGYPLALSEAHIQANISEQEKQLFLNLIINKGSKKNQRSEKSLNKKRSFL